MINRRYSKTAPRIAFRESDVNKNVIISINKESIHFENSDQVFHIHSWGQQIELNDDEISEDVIIKVTEEHNGVVELKSGSWFLNSQVVIMYEDIVDTREKITPIKQKEDNQDENIFSKFFTGEKSVFETTVEEYVTTDVNRLRRCIATIHKTMTVDGNSSNIQSSITPLPRVVIEMLEKEVPFNPIAYITHFQKVINIRDSYFEDETTYKHTNNENIQDLTLESDTELYVLKNHYTSEGITFTEKAIESGYTNALEIGQQVEWWIIYDVMYVKHIDSGGTYICESVPRSEKMTKQNTHVLDANTRVFKVEKTAEYIEFDKLFFSNTVDLDLQLINQAKCFEKFKNSGIVTTINSNGLIEQIPIQMLRIYDDDLFKEDMHLFGILRILQHQEHRCKLIGYYNKYCSALAGIKTGLRFIKTVNYAIPFVAKTGEAMLEKFGSQQIFYTLPNGDLLSPEEYVNYPNALSFNIGEIDIVYSTPDIDVSNLFNAFAPTKTLFVNPSEFKDIAAAVLTSMNSLANHFGNAVKCSTTTRCRNNAFKNIFEQYNAIVKSVSYYLETDKSNISISSDIMRKLNND